MRYLSFIFVFLVSASALSADDYKPRAGDIVFQASRSPQSLAIQLATKSRYCHVGIVFLTDGAPFVYEALEPVRFTPLQQWIDRGVDSHFVAKRLLSADSVLTPQSIAKMLEAGKPFEGKSYDFFFSWSDSTLYCSELVWKIYDRALGIDLGKPQKMRDFDLTHPVVKAKLQERFGDAVPLEETVVAPSTIFDSQLLRTVYQNKTGPGSASK